MLKIDSHQHFWKYNDEMASWITPEMAILRRDFMPEDLAPILNCNDIDGCVAIQVNQSAKENIFQLSNAEKNDFVKGVVGWVDLQSADRHEQLAELSKQKKLRGFRHILQGEPDRALMLKSSFLKGISALSKYNFTYDILIYNDQLKYIPEFVSQFPDQRFVLNHMAKPDIKNGSIAEWSAGIKPLKEFDNLSCKISGMFTEADWNGWNSSDFEPYLDVVFETFGTRRLMFGSDWPVCLVAATYADARSVLERYTSKLTSYEQELFWGGNAVEFYNLK